MKTNAKAFSIDANVILRFVLGDHEKLSPKARTIIQDVRDGRIIVMCDPIILAEVIWVLSSYYERTRAEICDALQPILKSDCVIMPIKSRYIHALELYGSTQAHFADACACAAALEDCDGRLLSFDRKLSVVEGIKRTESPGV
jgi:predicted nucleic acid-binding protein